MDPGDPDGLAVEIYNSAHSDRVVVLGYLNALAHVGVEVGLPGEPGGVGHFASEHLGELDSADQDLPVEDRPGSRHTEAGGAHVGVGCRSIGGGAGAEHLRFGGELHVDLQSDLHRLTSAFLTSNCLSHSSAMVRSTSSFQWSDTNCIPMGMPSALYPQGQLRWGVPARLAGTVRKSAL